MYLPVCGQNKLNFYVGHCITNFDSIFFRCLGCEFWYDGCYKRECVGSLRNIPLHYLDPSSQSQLTRGMQHIVKRRCLLNYINLISDS